MISGMHTSLGMAIFAGSRSTLKKIRGVARHATKPLPLEVKR